MYQRIRVKTTVDITQTNTTGRFRQDQVPYPDATGFAIRDLATWTLSRNQQRNLETLTQILLLRTQISDITSPIETDSCWSFEFTVDAADAYGRNLENLIADLTGVPMIPINSNSANQLITSGPEQNVWLEVIR